MKTGIIVLLLVPMIANAGVLPVKRISGLAARSLPVAAAADGKKKVSLDSSGLLRVESKQEGNSIENAFVVDPFYAKAQERSLRIEDSERIVISGFKTERQRVIGKSESFSSEKIGNNELFLTKFSDAWVGDRSGPLRQTSIDLNAKGIVGTHRVNGSPRNTFDGIEITHQQAGGKIISGRTDGVSVVVLVEAKDNGLLLEKTFTIDTSRKNGVRSGRTMAPTITELERLGYKATSTKVIAEKTYSSGSAHGLTVESATATPATGGK